MAWTKLTTIGEVPKDDVIEVEHNGNLYAICNVGGEIRAMSGVCPHEGGPLGQGGLVRGIVVCPFHMWEFDSKTGACLVDDLMRVPVYPVKVERNDILVDLPENA
jgi:nitrite reductase/ring-hydroxylating ferredoxin subunit